MAGETRYEINANSGLSDDISFIESCLSARNLDYRVTRRRHSSIKDVSFLANAEERDEILGLLLSKRHSVCYGCTPVLNQR